MATPRLRHAFILPAIAFALIALPAVGFAQPGIPDTSADQYDALITSGQTFDSFGNSIDIISDLDGDGIEDIIVGDPRSDLGGLNAGRVMVFSGRTGATLLNIVGSVVESDFGNSVANAGDTNGDGVDDILIGSCRWDLLGTPNGTNDDRGAVYLYSGATGQELWMFPNPFAGDHDLGKTIGVIGDIDGDGCSDIVAGSTIGVYVLSGKTGLELHMQFIAGIGVVAVAAVGDVNGDGTPDYAAGFNFSDIAGIDSGEVRVFSGADHSVIWQLADPATIALGDTVAGADVNGDGFSDLIASSQNFPGPGGTGAGRVVAFDGATGAILYRLDGDPSVAPFGDANPGDHFGAELTNVGDLDGDLCDDFLVLALGNDVGGINTARTYLYSGKTGTRIRTWTGTTLPGGVSAAMRVSRIGDFDGDGATDFVAVFFTSDNQTFVRGHVALFLASPFPPCTADQDNDQIVTSVDLAILIGSWGTASPTADINGDGIVDAADLATLLGQWGAWGFFNIQLP